MIHFGYVSFDTEKLCRVGRSYDTVGPERTANHTTEFKRLFNTIIISLLDSLEKNTSVG